MLQIGKYRVIRMIGEGGMGRVYEASDPVINRRVAIKTISDRVLQSPEARGRFLREAQSAGQLSHPNLITIHDVGEHEGVPFIVMEYLEGEELTGHIAKGRLAVELKLRLMIDVCQAMAYAHGKGLVHRDIKPANIFVTTQQTVKILDFGLARGLVSDLTQTGNVVGTPNYMAPEQIRGDHIDGRADIFATGVVLYELLSGRKPFSANTTAATIYQVLEHQPQPLDELDPQIPGDLAKIVQRAIEKNPTTRYQRIEEMAADLTRIRIGADSTLILGSPAPAAPGRAAVSAVVTAVRPRPAAGEPPQAGPDVASQPRPSASKLWAATALVGAITLLLITSLIFRSSQSTPPTETQSAPATATPPAQTVPGAPAPSAAGPVTPPPAAAATTAPKSETPTTKAPAIAESPPTRSSVPAVAAPPAPAAPTVQPPAPPPAAPERAAVPEPPPQPAAPAPAAPPVAAAPPPPAPAPAPAPAPPAPPPPAPVENPVAAINDLLGRYKSALEARDLAALKQIWPGLAGRQEAAIKGEFDNARTIGVTLSAITPAITNNTAIVTCRREYTVTTSDRKTLRSATKMTVNLDRKHGVWLIENIRHDAER